MGRISDAGGMEWTFTGELIEWRGPAPYLFVAMTPEESEDLKEAARGLIYWGPGAKDGPTEGMELRQPDDQVIAVKVIVK
jgi:hypothetical protein